MCLVLCLFFRFWALPDPVKLDETLSGEKQQSRDVQPVVKCENKASHKNDLLRASLPLLISLAISYFVSGGHGRDKEHFSSFTDT